MKKTKLFMDTVVDIQVVSGEEKLIEEVEAAIDRAFQAFQQIEKACSRFSPDSELLKACRTVGTPVPVSPLLFAPLKFALEMADLTAGVFDPSVGKVMEEHGFNRHYLTGKSVDNDSAESVTFRDILLNERDSTLYLRKPMVIDLGAVAKGFAIDLAANELKGFDGFIINAGGDLYAAGVDSRQRAWEIGIRHPERREQVIHMLERTDMAICTSGSYERKSAAKTGMHHLFHPLTKQSPNDWLSCSVIAPFAMMADAFSTAVFLLGAEKGPALLEEAELEGLLIAPDLRIVHIGGMS